MTCESWVRVFCPQIWQMTLMTQFFCQCLKLGLKSQKKTWAHSHRTDPKRRRKGKDRRIANHESDLENQGFCSMIRIPNLYWKILVFRDSNPYWNPKFHFVYKANAVLQPTSRFPSALPEQAEMITLWSLMPPSVPPTQVDLREAGEPLGSPHWPHVFKFKNWLQWSRITFNCILVEISSVI